MSNNVVVQILAFAFRFILIPVILLGILGWSWNLAGSDSSSSDGRERRVAAFWLGLAIAALIIVLNLFTSSSISLGFDAAQPFQLDSGGISGNVLLGVALGLGVMAAHRFLPRTIAAPILIAALSGGSLIALYQYFFDSQSRDRLLILSLSFIIGVVGFRVFDVRYNK